MVMIFVEKCLKDTSGYSVVIYGDGKTVDIFGTHNDGYVSNSEYESIYDPIHIYWVKVGDDIDEEMQFCQESLSEYLLMTILCLLVLLKMMEILLTLGIFAHLLPYWKCVGKGWWCY